MIVPSVLKRFSVGDSEALERLARRVARDRMVIIEVGSWIGTSTFVLARVAAKVGGSVIAVDHWRGSGDLVELARAYDIMGIFLSIARAQDYLGSVVAPFIADSALAGKLCRDCVADMVFIDAGHTYADVLTDLSVWYPKLKPGGLLCGHDCERLYAALSDNERAVADLRVEEEYVKDIGHVGVMKATHDFLKGDIKVMADSTVWYHVKSGKEGSSRYEPSL